MASTDSNVSPTQQSTFTLPPSSNYDPLTTSSSSLPTPVAASHNATYLHQHPTSHAGGRAAVGSSGGIASGNQQQQSGTGGDPASSIMAPKFPPQNFDVPDINFSNSLAHPNFGMNSIPPGSFYNHPSSVPSNNSPPLYQQQHLNNPHHLDNKNAMAPVSTTTSSAPMHPHANTAYSGVGFPAVPNTGIHAMSGLQGPSGGGHSRQQQPALSSNACTSPQASSSDDSDDLPLAQIASMKRAADAAMQVQSSSATETATGGSTTDTAASAVDTSPTPGKKAKPTKRKKKKDPNEPTKPVSAYALFFRDTQANIKNHNPSASFGEVSKIVASMWDQLDPDTKDVYKKKTENAKKLYLKQLAAYRASQVSQSAGDEMDKSPSPPGMGMGHPGMMTNSGMMHPTGGQGGPVMSPTHMNAPMRNMAPQMMQHTSPLQQQFFHPQDPLLQQHNQQLIHQQQHHHLQQQQFHQMQQQPDQFHHQQQQHQMSNMPPPYSQQQMQQQQSPPLQQPQHSPPQQQQQQLHNQQHSPPGGVYHQSSPHSNNMPSAPQQMNNVSYQPQTTNLDMDPNFTPCTRNGCSNQAQENSAWDMEFCSQDCVITHCRDVFTNWTTARSGSVNAFPVK